MRPKPRETLDDDWSDRVPEPDAAGRPCRAAAHLVAVARPTTAPAAYRLPADPHPCGPGEPAAHTRQDTLVAHPSAHGGCGAGDPGPGRPGIESQPRDGACRLR